jgi:hypothetical protein
VPDLVITGRFAAAMACPRRLSFSSGMWHVIEPQIARCGSEASNKPSLPPLAEPEHEGERQGATTEILLARCSPLFVVA